MVTRAPYGLLLAGRAVRAAGFSSPGAQRVNVVSTNAIYMCIYIYIERERDRYIDIYNTLYIISYDIILLYDIIIRVCYYS